MEGCTVAGACTTCVLSRCLHQCAAAAPATGDVSDVVARLLDFDFYQEDWQQDAGEVLEALLQNVAREVGNRFEVQLTFKTTCAFGHRIQRHEVCKLFQVQVADRCSLQDMVENTMPEEQVEHRCDACVLGTGDACDPVCEECHRIVHEYHRATACAKGSSACQDQPHPRTDCIGAALRQTEVGHNFKRRPVESKQQMYIRKAPQHLVVHEKRFGYRAEQAQFKLFNGCMVEASLDVPYLAYRNAAVCSAALQLIRLHLHHAACRTCTAVITSSPYTTDCT